MKSLAGPIIKSIVFIVVTVLSTAVLAITIMNGSGTGGHGYGAVFADATSLQSGDDVRMAGVRIGQVSDVSVTNRRQAKVTFEIQDDVRLARTVTATIKYRNLIGQRYLSLAEGSGSLADPLPRGATIPIARTTPALDLTALFDGFQPLFKALDPEQINALSGEMIAVFQGEGPTIDDLLGQTAVLTNTLANKGKVIDELIDNLNSVLGVVNKHGGQLGTLVGTLSRFVAGLAADRVPLGKAIAGLGDLSGNVADLLSRGRGDIHASITKLGALSSSLAGSSGALNTFLQNLPVKLNDLGRTASYGSWLNFYLCSVTGRIPVPAEYYGGVGVQPVASRCSS